MDQFVVVAEAGLSGNTYGAQISMSEPGSQAQTRAYLEEVVAGAHPDFAKIPDQARIVRVSDDVVLVIEPRRLQPDRLTRLTVGRLS
jgi:hypothetical protein